MILFGSYWDIMASTGWILGYWASGYWNGAEARLRFPRVPVPSCGRHCHPCGRILIAPPAHLVLDCELGNISWLVNCQMSSLGLIIANTVNIHRTVGMDFLNPDTSLGMD